MTRAGGTLFGLLLPPALDRLRNLLVVFRHLGEAVLPQALRSRPVPLPATRIRATSVAYRRN
jgi:hypothetical protein